MRTTLLAAALFTSISAHAAEPVTVLGLPIGGKLSKPVRACYYLNRKANAELATCWVYSTSTGKGGKSGMLNVQGEDKMPSWAAAAEFQANMTGDGTLTELTVISKPPSEASRIIESISMRFGRPSYSELHPPLKWSALWDMPTIRISLLCNAADACHTRFVSAEVAAEERKRINARAKIEAARPIAP